MIEQTIRLVVLETNPNGITIRFGLLGNTSHQKHIINLINSDVQKLLGEAERAGESFDFRATNNKLYDERFPTLDTMNSDGWKLESFALIYDANLDRMQVAIFSREV